MDAAANQPKPETAKNRATWLEIDAVVILITAPTFASLGRSVFTDAEADKTATTRRHFQSQTATAFAAAELKSAVLRLRFAPIMLFVMWRSGEGWSRFGFAR